jgi:hypothetical protein
MASEDELTERYCNGFRDGKRGTLPKHGGIQHCLPAFYAILYDRLVPVARAHDYSLAMHGSLARDLDLIAVPWIEAASGPLVLIEAMRAHIGGEHGILWPVPTEKPHGRKAWTIALGGGPYLDVSVMPRQVAVESA